MKNWYFPPSIIFLKSFWLWKWHTYSLGSHLGAVPEFLSSPSSCDLSKSGQHYFQDTNEINLYFSLHLNWQNLNPTTVSCLDSLKSFQILTFVPCQLILEKASGLVFIKTEIWSGYSTTQSPSMGSQSTQSTSSLPRCVLAPARSSGLVSCFSWYPHPLLIGVQMLRLRFSQVRSPFPEFCVYGSLPSAFFLNLSCGCFLFRLQVSISISSPHKDLLWPPSHYWYSVS